MMANGRNGAVETETGTAQQREEKANNSGKSTRLFLPTGTCLNRVLKVLPNRLRRHDRAKAAPSP